MPPLLDEEAVEGEEASAGESVVAEPVAAVFQHHRLEVVQRAMLEIHVETLSLEPAQLGVGEHAVIVDVADLEDSTQGFLTVISQLNELNGIRD